MVGRGVWADVVGLGRACVGDCGGAEGGGAEFEGGPEEEVEVEHVVL